MKRGTIFLMVLSVVFSQVYADATDSRIISRSSVAGAKRVREATARIIKEALEKDREQLEKKIDEVQKHHSNLKKNMPNMARPAMEKLLQEKMKQLEESIHDFAAYQEKMKALLKNK